MKAKRLLTLALAVLMAALTVVSASAAQLTEDKPDGKTEVKAHINGNTPGDVSYIITIPDVVDFGLLTQPENKNNPVYKDVNYTVTATQITGLDDDTQQVSVYVRDENATVNGDQEFWITNKTDSTKKFKYDVYDKAAVTDGDDSINNGTMAQAAGYFLNGFTTTGEEIEGTLRLDQTQLCDYNLSEIVGEYSGYMVFFSMIEDQ